MQHGQRQVKAGAAAGVEVGGHCNRNAGIEQLACGQVRLLQVHRGQRQADGDGAGLGKRRDPLIVDVLQVLGRNRTQARRQLRPAAGAELVGVQLDTETVAGSRGQYPLALGHGIGPLFDKGIAEFSQPLIGDTGNQAPAKQFDVCRPVVCILGRDDMRAQKRGNHLDPVGFS